MHYLTLTPTIVPLMVWFSFEGLSRRQALIAIGNGVPSELGRHLSAAARVHIETARGAYRSLLAAAALLQEAPDLGKVSYPELRAALRLLRLT